MRKKSYDLLITDLKMAEVNGIEILEMMRMVQHTRGSRPLLPSCHNLQSRAHRRLRHHLFGISHLVVRGAGDCQYVPRVLRPDRQNNRPVCHLGRERNGQDGVDP